MASSIVVLQLGSTYGVFLISVIVAAALYGVTVLQSLYYFAEFPKDKLILKVTVGILWALDMLTVVLNSHAVYFYFISNFGNISALNHEVWSIQAELLVTYTVVLIVQVFFILRIYYLRPHLWYIPISFGLLAIASYASLLTVFIRVIRDINWSDTGTSNVIPPIIANWVTGNIVDIGITVVLCWYLWSEKAGVPHRTDVMLNRIIVFLVNRGAISAVVQVLTLLMKFVSPRTFVWLAFHNILSKVYTNSLLATLNARVSFRKIIMDYELDQTKPPTEFSARLGRPISKVPPLSESHHISTVEFVDEPGPIYPPATLDHRGQRSAYTTHDSYTTSTGIGSSVYDQRGGRASSHQRVIASDQGHAYGGVAIAAPDHPPYVNHAASAGSRYTRTTLRRSRDDPSMKLVPSNAF